MENCKVIHPTFEGLTNLAYFELDTIIGRAETAEINGNQLKISYAVNTLKGIKSDILKQKLDIPEELSGKMNDVFKKYPKANQIIRSSEGY